MRASSLRPALSRSRLRCLVVGAFVLTFASCGTPSAEVAIHIDQATALLDTPLSIVVSGLQAGERVTVKARTTDSASRIWEAQATFEADSNGSIDLGRSAPMSGSYKGAVPMGLFSSLHSADVNPANFQFIPGATGYVVTLTAQVGRAILASAEVKRLRTAAGVATRDMRPSDAGFYGRYFSPGYAPTLKPGLLLFGGSSGGLTRDVEAGLLASHGYPTLELAYFSEPGLPPSLSRIPLEYFVRALEWLRAQPGVDASHLVVDGVSRGCEAALLLGVDYPNLVGAVIALDPSSVALCAYPTCDGAAWTLGGKNIPYTSMFDEPYPTDEPSAVIPVERIHGPILLDCGAEDKVWVSCDFATAILNRLGAARYPYEDQVLRYSDAGHGIGFPVPFVPDYSVELGGSELGQAADRVDQWPRMLGFLAMVGT